MPNEDKIVDKSTPSDQLLTKLNEVLDWAGAKAGAGEAFIEQQAPLIAREIVTCGRFVHTVPSFLLIIWAISALLISKRLGRWKTKLDGQNRWTEDQCIGMTLSWGGVSAASLLFGIVWFSHLSSLSKAWFAPRLYIIEYVSKLL